MTTYPPVDTSHRTRTNRTWEAHMTLPDPDDLQLLSVKDVARKLRESEGTVYKLIKSGQLAAIRRTEGGLLKIRETELHRFIQDQYQEA